MIWKKAAELQYGKLPAAGKGVGGRGGKVKNQDLSLVHENVTEEEIAGSSPDGQEFRWQSLTESERNKTLHLDEQLHKRVVGQDEGVEKGDGGHYPVPRPGSKIPPSPSAPSCS